MNSDRLATPANRTGPDGEPSNRPELLLLILGYAALTVALVTAMRTPTGPYEISIYRSLPALFWAGAGLALVVGVVSLLRAPNDRRVGAAGVGLVALGSVSVASLPLLRSHYFYGAGDSLSHLG
mgnify:CR=1 FL=1